VRVHNSDSSRVISIWIIAERDVWVKSVAFGWLSQASISIHVVSFYDEHTSIFRFDNSNSIWHDLRQQQN
jgi:hypothetical protein